MPVSQKVRDLLVCPNCEGELLFEADDIICSSCGKVGMLDNNVLRFNTQKITGVQKAFYDDRNYVEGIKKQKEFQHSHYNPHSLSGMLESFFKNELMKIVVNDERPFVDIGCGTGSGFKHLGYPKDIVGIDISFELTKSCKENFPEADCICCDIIHPPLKKNSLKTIFCLETLVQVFYLEHFVESIESLLSDEGFFYVLIPAEGGFIWNILRNIAHYKYSKKLHVNYKKLFSKVHCNTAYTVDNVLKKFFRIDLVRNIPWTVGGTDLNLVKLYRLRKS